jgi:hypothetical protein
VHRVVTEPDRFGTTKGEIPAGVFKQPTSNILKLLSDRGNLSSEWDVRLRQYLNNRHLLVHRWIIERGVPTTDEDWDALRALAITVEQEATVLTTSFREYALRFGDPESKEFSADLVQSRMRELFSRPSTGDPDVVA